MQAAIDAYRNNGLMEGLSYSRPERIPKWFRRHPRTSAGVLTATAAAVCLLFYYWYNQKLLLSAAKRLDEAYKESQQTLAAARRNLGRSHAGWAAVEEAKGHRHEAQFYSALAFGTAAGAKGEDELPEPGSWNPEGIRLDRYCDPGSAPTGATPANGEGEERGPTTKAPGHQERRTKKGLLVSSWCLRVLLVRSFWATL